MKLEHFLTPCTKINLKWIKDLAARPETIKLEHFDKSRSNTFLDLSTKTKEIKAKINKRDLIKLKSFCTAKEIIKMKRQPMDWEMMFANDAINTGLIPKIYKQLIQLKIKKKKKSPVQMDRRPEQTFFQKPDMEATQVPINRGLA